MDVNDHIEILRSHHARGKVALFLGAGASSEAGLPSGKGLAAALQTEFPKAQSPSNDPMEVLTAILDTPGYNRSGVEVFLRRLLQSTGLSQPHKVIPKQRWRAIFTTNWDDLIEFAYRSDSNRAQHYNPVLSPDQVTDTSDLELVNVYKIMGCVTRQSPSEGEMVLTRSDYTRLVEKRGNTIKTLRDIAIQGPILYIGYSFDDRLALDVMDGICRDFALERLCWSYAVMPGVSHDERAVHRLSLRRVIPIDATFSEIMGCLSSPCFSAAPVTASQGVSLNLGFGKTVHFTHAEIRSFSEQLEILTDEDLGKARIGDNLTIREFFSGSSKSWTAYAHRYDVPRSQYAELERRVLASAADRDPDRSRGFVLSGPAGSGKTVLLRRLAWNLCTERHIPTVFLREDKDSFDFRIIDRFLSSLSDKAAGPSVSPLPHVVLILDNAKRMALTAERLLRFLSSRGRSVTVILSGRPHELEETRLDETGESSAGDSLNRWERITLADVIADEEIAGLVAHLKSHQLLPQTFAEDIPFFKGWVQTECKNSFFVALYLLVKEFRSPFERIILDEYTALDPVAQKVYRIVCLFDQYSYRVKLELLIRAIDWTYEEFVERVYRRSALGVISEVSLPQGVICYSARHRIIAERLMDIIHGQGTERIGKMFCGVLTEFNPSDRYEMELVRTIVAKVIGSNGVEYRDRKRITAEESREVFNTCLAIAPHDQTILHHYGLFESDCGDFEKAERLLLTAQGIETRGSGRATERSQHILVSLGVLYQKVASELWSNGRTEEAEAQCQRAYERFREGRLGDFDNEHAYHAHAFGLMCRASRERDRGHIEKAETLYSEALTVIDQGYETLGPRGTDELSILEARVLESAGRYEECVRRYEVVLQHDPGNMQVYYLLGRTLLSQGIALRNEGDTERHALFISTARKVVEEALEKSPTHRASLRLMTRLLRMSDPEETERLYEVLMTRYTIPEERDCLEMLYDLGRISFSLGKYRDSHVFFDELESICPVHPGRRGIHHRLKDRSGNLVKLAGNVERIVNQKEGWIRCDETADMIRFTPFRQNLKASRGDRVFFTLGFNYGGAFAVDMEKV